ncbi:hypothetical protein Gotur_030463 [Gossypium turneri]
MNITGMNTRKKVDVFALSIYGLIVFPKILGHVDEAVTDLFDQFDKRVTPVPIILAETFRSLNACRRTEEGRFIGCAQLLLASFYSHFWKVDKVSYQGAVGYAPLLVLRQYRSRQFLLATQGLAECKFLYKDDGYKRKAPEMANAWNQTRRMKRLVVSPMITSEYGEWWVRRINDNIPGPKGMQNWKRK